MTRIDPFSLASPQRVTEVITVSDPSNPDVKLTCEFAALDMVQYNYSEELAMQFIKKYILDELPFPGEPFKLSRPLIATACSTYVMQVEGVYSVEEWLVISYKMPRAWSDLIDKLTALTNRGPLGKVASVSQDTSGASSESQ